MRLVSAVLAKNEASRYLERVLRRCLQWSDRVLLLDDRSVDDTPKLAAALGCQVRGRSVLKGDAWGKETPARQELWDWAVEEAGDGWVLVCDADMLLHGDPRPLCYSWECNSWAWPLVDLWNSEQTYRIDGPWEMAPNTPRVWMVCPSRVPAGWQAQWGQRGIHSGHLPPNFPFVTFGAPSDVYWLHLGWIEKEHRQEKYQRYKSVEAQLSDFEKAHVESILE